MNKFLVCLVVCIFTATSSSGQESQKQTCDIPVVVTRFAPSSTKVETVKGLGPKDFIVQVGGVPATAEGASIDGGPRRVALILDASAAIHNNEWKLATEMAVKLVQHAGRGDRFALLFVGLGNRSNIFLSSKELIDQLKKLASSRPKTTEPGEKTYDAILKASSRLDPPEFGDALFLFGHPADSGSKTDPDQLLELILKNRLRFYGMSFDFELPRHFDPNKPLPTTMTIPKLADMSAATGYYFSFHSVESLQFPGQNKLFEEFLGDLYRGIAEPYRLKIPTRGVSSRTKLEVAVTKPNERRIETKDVHYPSYIYPCSVLSAATP